MLFSENEPARSLFDQPTPGPHRWLPVRVIIFGDAQLRLTGSNGTMATKATSSKTAKTKKGVAQGATRGRETTAKTVKPQAKAPARPATRAVAKNTTKPPAKRASAPAKQPVAKPAKTASTKSARKPATSPAATNAAAARVAAVEGAAAESPSSTPAAAVAVPQAEAEAKAAPSAASKPAPTAQPATKPAPAGGAARKVEAPAAASSAPPVAATTPAAPAITSGHAATPTVSAPPASNAPQIAAAQTEAVDFAVGDHVVYPTHGVGRVTGIVTEEIAGHRLTLIVVEFEDNRMVLRVPVAKAKSAGLRKLSSRKAMEQALATLKGRARIKRTMWSRRAQEYEAKINSGDPIAIAEVVRDLHRNAGQPDQSFSERQIYEQALDRLAAELAAIEQVDKATATAKLVSYLKTA